MYSGPSRRHQTHGLPIYYAESSYSGQASQQQQLQNFQFDMPRTTSEQFMTSAVVNPIPLQYTRPSQMGQTSMSWADASMTTFDDQNTGYYSTYSPSIMESPHDMSEVPRYLPNHSNGFSDSGMVIDAAYDPSPISPYNLQSSFNLHQPQPQSYLSPVRERLSRISISPSPVPKVETQHGGLPTDDFHFRLPSSEDSSEGVPSSREMTAAVGEDHDPSADEPYAKLIYRALMSAPNHSMVLQEIYQWFRENTVKGSSDTKGWMNSIRHNLSMNAAFKKTERKVPGDESKKSTEWVLEPFAIKDGVQSTTRYRKGTGIKKFGSRAEAPAPARQSSGRKGGISTSRHHRTMAAAHRQHHGKTMASSPTSTSRVDPGRREQFRQHTREEIIQKRQRSPLTPPHPEGMMGDAGLQGYALPKVEPFEAFGEEYGLEHTQGVYEEKGPVFLSQEMQPYGMPNRGY